MEENPGPTIFDIIDPTTTVSADSSFFFQLSATVIERSRFIYTSIITSKVMYFTQPLLRTIPFG